MRVSIIWGQAEFGADRLEPGAMYSWGFGCGAVFAGLEFKAWVSDVACNTRLTKEISLQPKPQNYSAPRTLHDV